METFTDGTVVALASFLSPHDMLSLALTCKRFGDKHGADTKRSAAREESSMRNVRLRTETISLMEVAARTVLHAKWTDEEKKALPRREDKSWIGIYQEFLLVFRMPLQFDKLVGGGIKYASNIDKTKVCSSSRGVYGTAICSNIMRAGRHTVSFQLNDGDVTNKYGVTCGIMRPTTKDIISLGDCHPADGLSKFSLKDYETLYRNNIDCCLMNTVLGTGFIRKRWKLWKESELRAMDRERRLQAEEENELFGFDWAGEEETREASFKIGFALDLDEGTLDVYKNDRRLGTMISGLVGEYCWVVSLRPNDEGEAKTVSVNR